MNKRAKAIRKARLRHMRKQLGKYKHVRYDIGSHESAGMERPYWRFMNDESFRKFDAMAVFRDLLNRGDRWLLKAFAAMKKLHRLPPSAEFYNLKNRTVHQAIVKMMHPGVIYSAHYLCDNNRDRSSGVRNKGQQIKGIRTRVSLP